MPNRTRSQLSRNSSQARAIKIRRHGECQSETENRLAIPVAPVARTCDGSNIEAHWFTEKPTHGALRSSARFRDAYCRVRNRVLAHSNRSAFTYDPQIDYAQQSSVQIRAMEKICSKCSAKKWADEPNDLCCASGKVSLPNIQEPPEPIKSLLTNNNLHSRNFLTNIRRYNSLFQMTSFGAKEIREQNCMPTFKIEDQVYHLIGSLLPQSGQNPQFLQIYFISDADQLSLRSNIAPTLNIDLIKELQTALNSHNIYIRSFKQNLEQNSLDNLKLIIHSDRPIQRAHPGRYNAPAVNEVAVLLVDEEKGPRDGIMLHGRDGQLKRVSELHRSYDPLQYPLMFVMGEDGYYLTIPQEGTARNKTVTYDFGIEKFKITWVVGRLSTKRSAGKIISKTNSECRLSI
ncbi:uncharacterized protein LOC132942139 [Metopolophium dirhodum]|uniref:uncharacterized protein LOC132942139 n=1 Tax=Metopolophium dirhodum TaxID=44670 RepID=UPI00298FC2C6|nr:uncharacterized protein LOC132942139 [Metopolophium dirhodum]